jgi:hypothetical protein
MVRAFRTTPLVGLRKIAGTGPEKQIRQFGNKRSGYAFE